MKMSHTMKAFLACGIFIIFLVVSIYTMSYTGDTALPIVIFYILLIVNTFFSVKLFDQIIPNLLSQKLIDTILVLLYAALAFTLGNAPLFTLVLACFFLVSSQKYVSLLGVVHQPTLLKRKICANILGALLGLIVLALILYGFTSYALWGLVAVFALANIYFFFISPLYKLDNH